MPHFIVLEGLDGAGTTTQTERLCRWFEQRNEPVHRTCEPTDLPVGRLIRRVLRQESGVPYRSALPYLFASDRHDHLTREVQPALDRGEHVVSDRYVPSSLAYQTLELPMDRIWSLNQEFRAPDLTLWLRISVDDAMARISQRGDTVEVYEQRALLDHIASHYQEAFARLERRGDHIVEIDATLPMDTVTERMLAAVQAL